MYDCIVIGGGSAGLMASIAAAERGATVLLLEKGNKLGRKLAISGGGRCNVTNRKPIDELIQNIPGNGRFMHSPFSIFNNEDIIRFFEKMGIKLKEEDNGRMFPVTDSAQTVVSTLIEKARSLKVEMRLNTPVKNLIFTDEEVTAVLLHNGEEIKANAIIVATGGKSVPHTGSTGDAYPWAKKAGHTITDLYPTEVPITSKEPFFVKKELLGLSLRDIELSVFNEKQKRIVTHRGDMIFTHFGISGPCALRCSQFVVKQIKKGKSKDVVMKLDLMPEQTVEETYQLLKKQIEQEPKKAIKNSLKGIVPDRFLAFLFDTIGIDGTIAGVNTANDVIRRLAEKIKGFEFRVDGTLSLEKAFVTGGGVTVKEIQPKTMESKKMKRLFFCGEVLDIHGYTGGYNITVAFSTGYTAGMSAATKYKHTY